jgi:hypothetical protein
MLGGRNGELRKVASEMDARERIRVMELTLQRLLGLVSAADSKISAVFAAGVAMLGVLAALAPRPACWTLFTGLTSFAAALLVLVSLVLLSVCAFPRLEGPTDSLLFFASIAKQTPAGYKAGVAELTEEAYVHDLTEQCQRNATIAFRKFLLVRWSLVVLFFAIPVWLIAVYGLYQLRQ